MERLGLLPFYKLTTFWLIGIAVYSVHSSLTYEVFIALLLFCFATLTVLVFTKTPILPSKKWLITLLVGILFSNFAYSTLWVKNAKNHGSHILNQPGNAVLVELIESAVSKNASVKSKAKVVCVKSKNGWKNGTGEMLLYLLDSNATNYKIGNQLLIKGKCLQRVEEPRNPSQFNYAGFLANKGIYHQAFLRPNDYVLYSTKSTWSLSETFAQLRSGLIKNLSFLSNKTRPVAEALLLGYKENLDHEVREIFAKTGTMHILAVSGLHVGIIYKVVDLLLMFLLGVRYGKPMKVSMVLLVIWSYALLTGLPPSVLRASFMFSLVAIGTSLNRPNNIFNNVLASAFVMLAISPKLIFDVGFQLSYAAVFGIISIQPFLAQWFRPKNQIIKFTWDLITVSFAAQIATLPFTLYYFNQVPLIFPISNLIAIPGAFLVVGLGALLQIASAVGGVVASAFQWLYQFVLNILVGGIDYLSSFSFANIDHIVISLSTAIFLAIITITFSFGFIIKNKRWLLVSLTILLFWSGIALYKSAFDKPPNEFVVFYTHNQSAYGYKTHEKAYVILKDSLSKSISFETEGWFKALDYVDTLYLNSPFTDTDIYASANIIGLNGLKLGHNLKENNAFFSYTIFSKERYFENMESFNPERCIFDASVKPDWVLDKYPNFAQAHFVQRDGAFVKKIE